MQRLPFKNILSILDDYDVFLFDLWGVIVEGGGLYSGVVEVINKIIEQKKVFFVSNAPLQTITSYHRISSWGIKTVPEMVCTSGGVARKLISGLPQSKILHLGKDRSDDILSGLNCHTTDDIEEADILLMTLYRDEGDNLEEFDQLLKIAADRGITNICANPDTIIPNQGSNRYCSGYFAEKIEKFGGKVIYTGKPYPEIYDKVFKNTDVPKSRILMVGDTFDTDILGASRVGINSALVMTGNAKRIHAEYETLDDKLLSITKVASAMGLYPDFVTVISEA